MNLNLQWLELCGRRTIFFKNHLSEDVKDSFATEVGVIIVKPVHRHTLITRLTHHTHNLFAFFFILRQITDNTISFKVHITGYEEPDYPFHVTKERRVDWHDNVEGFGIKANSKSIIGHV